MTASFTNQSLLSGLENVTQLVGKFAMMGCVILFFGISGQGRFALFLTIQATASTIAGLGLEPSLIFWASKTSPGKDLQLLLGRCIALMLLLGGLSAVIVYWASSIGLFGDEFSGAERAILAFSCFLGTSSLILGGLLGGLGRFDLRLLLALFQFILPLAGFLLLALNGDWVFAEMLLLMTASQFVGTLICTTALIRTTGGPTFDLILPVRELKFALRTYGYQILSTGAMRVDIYVISHTQGMMGLGYYSLALTAAETLLFIPKVVANPLLLRASLEAGRFPFCSAFRTLSAVTLLSCVIAFVASSFSFVLLPFDDARILWIVFAIVLPAMFSLGLATTSAYVLFGYAENKIPIIAAGAAFFVKILGCLILIPDLGIMGAAVATTLSYFAFLSVAITGVAKTLGNSPPSLLQPDFGGAWRGIREIVGRQKTD